MCIRDRVKGIQLDPQADADLIAVIKKKGEDGPHFIDGLMDFAKYAKKRRQNLPHSSYFNAYIDGKTNGIASNCLQMGNSETARRTGVTRNSSTDYLDEGDVRDVLKRKLLESLRVNGIPGHKDNYASEMNAVAEAVFSHRDLNKKTTMTFGYGKEIASFKSDMLDTIALLEADPSVIEDVELREAFIASLPTVRENLDPDVLGEALMEIYRPALTGVMSPIALKTRSTMRAASVLHAATDTLMAIKSATGMDLHFGKDVQEGYEHADITRYRLKFGDKQPEFKSAHRVSRPTSAAARTREDTVQPGEFAYGGSVVGPVQSLDAATVALSASGKSWDRMKAASNGKPYMHTIYDAFKVDAMGYDVALEEINTNWMNAGLNWSYLKNTQQATRETMNEWKKEIGKRNPDEELADHEAEYMKFIMEPKTAASGRQYMGNYLSKIGTAGDFRNRGLDPWKMQEDMQKAMRKDGYEWRDPPRKPTVQQLKRFVHTLEQQLNTDQRLSAAISTTEKNKSELRKEIMRNGYKTPSGRTIPLQYYAH